MWVPDERRLFRVTRSDEFWRCWAEIETQLTDPNRVLVAIQKGLARVQWGPTTHSFLDEDHRLLVIKEPLDDCELWVFFAVDRTDRTCEALWIHRRETDDDTADTEE